jgi:hypothetical protein
MPIPWPSERLSATCCLCDSSCTGKLGTLFVSMKYVLVSVKLVCVYVKFFKNLNTSKRGIFIITEKLGLFLQNIIG